jgi:uncharacterized membrane protein
MKAAYSRESGNVFSRERVLSRLCRPLRALLLAILLQSVGGSGCGNRAKYPELIPGNGVVAVDLAGIGAGSGRFHTYRSTSGKRIDLFVYRESSGMARAVLDACKTCYRWKKGYVVAGGEIVCIKCDMRFQLHDLARGSGSCIPIALTSEQEGASLKIPVAELEAGARFF